MKTVVMEQGKTAGAHYMPINSDGKLLNKILKYMKQTRKKSSFVVHSFHDRMTRDALIHTVVLPRSFVRLFFCHQVSCLRISANAYCHQYKCRHGSQNLFLSQRSRKLFELYKRIHTALKKSLFPTLLRVLLQLNNCISRSKPCSQEGSQQTPSLRCHLLQILDWGYITLARWWWSITVCLLAF